MLDKFGFLFLFFFKLRKGRARYSDLWDGQSLTKQFLNEEAFYFRFVWLCLGNTVCVLTSPMRSAVKKNKLEYVSPPFFFPTVIWTLKRRMLKQLSLEDFLASPNLSDTVRTYRSRLRPLVFFFVDSFLCVQSYSTRPSILTAPFCGRVSEINNKKKRRDRKEEKKNLIKRERERERIESVGSPYLGLHLIGYTVVY